METFLGIIPFSAVPLGVACVFFMKKSLGDLVERALVVCRRCERQRPSGAC